MATYWYDRENDRYIDEATGLVVNNVPGQDIAGARPDADLPGYSYIPGTSAQTDPAWIQQQYGAAPVKDAAGLYQLPDSMLNKYSGFDGSLMAFLAPLIIGTLGAGGALGGFGGAAGGAGAGATGLPEFGALASESGFVPGSFELGASGYGGTAAAGLDAATAEWLSSMGISLPNMPSVPGSPGGSGGSGGLPFNPLAGIPGALNSGGGGAGGGAGGAGNPLGSLAGIGTGLYDLLFGGQKVDPSKLNTLWQAGLDTYNTARDPQQALYGRTVQQLQDQTRAGQSARGTAMSPYGAAGEADVMKNFNIDWNNAQLGRQVQGVGALSEATGGYYKQANQDQARRDASLQSGTNALLTGVNSGLAPGGWLQNMWNSVNPTASQTWNTGGTPANYYGGTTDPSMLQSYNANAAYGLPY